MSAFKPGQRDYVMKLNDLWDAAAHIYPGSHRSDPTSRPDGDPIQVGDEYFDAFANLKKRYNGSRWVATDLHSANLASASGSGLVGHTPAGAGAVATTVNSLLLGLSASVFDFFTEAEKRDVASGAATIDVAPKINAAIASLGATARRGGRLYFPKGKYRIESSILLNEDSVCLVGDGYGEPGALSNTELSKMFNGAAILVSDAARKGQQLRWGIKNLVVEGNGHSGDGIYVKDAHYGRIEDVVVHNHKGDGNGVHFDYSYSNALHNVQSVANYRNFRFENQSHDIEASKCYSSSSIAEGFYITTSNALAFYGSTHEGKGSCGIWVNRLAKDVVFDGVYIEVAGGAAYTSCIRISEDTTPAYSVRNIAVRNAHIRVNGAYVLPVFLRSGIYGCVIENVNVEFHGVALDGNSRAVLIGVGAGGVRVYGVRISNVHCDVVQCRGSGLEVVAAAPNVADGGVEVVGCTCWGHPLVIGVGGKNHCRNGEALNGNHLAPVDFAALQPRASAPTYLQNASLVYADGAAWNPSGTGEGLHLVRGGTIRRIAEHSSSPRGARPAVGLYVGMQHFDMTLGKPIWWNGNAWVDASGARV
jgi:hypothetical protein